MVSTNKVTITPNNTPFEHEKDPPIDLLEILYYKYYIIVVI